MEQVKNQYIFPHLAGISEDNDIHADVVRINDMLMKAGIDQFQAEVQKQLNAYWKQTGY